MSRIRRIFLFWGSICIMAGFLHAGPLEYLYQFSYAPGPSDPIQAFAFSLVSPTLLTGGETLNFTPYAITDGTNTFTIVQGIAASGAGGDCFNFGTSTTSISSCSGSVQPGGAGFEATFNSGLPTTLGSFFYLFIAERPV